MDELIDEAYLMIVEWPEIGESLLPSNCMRVEIEHVSEGRNYSITY
jgi:tRNA A37 threonylcarbamoyladenosine biosynthesis protein TsaE